MADELNKKKPDLGSGSSSVSAPKPAQQPKPNPVSAPKPVANNFSAPKQKPAPVSQPKPVTAPKANPAPKLNHKPSKEALETANRKKIMSQGFKPNNQENKLHDLHQDAQSWLNKGDTYDFKVERPSNDNFTYIKRKNLMTDKEENFNYDRNTGKLTYLDGAGYKDIDYINNPDAEYHSSEEVRNNLKNAVPNEKKEWNKDNEPGSGVVTDELKDYVRNSLSKDPDLSKEFVDKTVNGLYSNSKQADFYKQKMKDEFERSKASEMFGTDLGKNQGPENYYDSLSKELDGGNFVNIDAGLLPYEHGFKTNGNEDLAVDARKGKDGKYELYMYPETENGPVSGYEPDRSEPTHVFDTFDDLKAFVENGYKNNETSEREKASELFGTDLNSKQQFKNAVEQYNSIMKKMYELEKNNWSDIIPQYDEQGREISEKTKFKNPEIQKQYDELDSQLEDLMKKYIAAEE